MSEKRRATPRVREHVDRLRAAGLDTQKVYDALVALRDDTALPRNHKESLYKLVAMESFLWYLEAIKNDRLDRSKLFADVQALKAAAPKVPKADTDPRARPALEPATPSPAVAAPPARPPPRLPNEKTEPKGKAPKPKK